MARLRTVTVTLGCISLLYLLPGTLSGGLRLARPKEPTAQTSSSGLQPPHPALWPVVWKPHQAPQPQGRTKLASAMGQPLQDGGSRHPSPGRQFGPRRRQLGPRRPQAQLLRVGCVLGTCQVQNLSHRLWQLVGPSGRRDSAPVDPSSPHSYG